MVQKICTYAKKETVILTCFIYKDEKDFSLVGQNTMDFEKWHMQKLEGGFLPFVSRRYS